MAEYPGIELRPFRPDEWQLYREVRLRALESDPKFFGSRYDDEKAKPDEFWQERLARGYSGVREVRLTGDP